MSGAPPLLACERLTRRFGRQRALDEVTLSLPGSGGAAAGGGPIALLGPNGAGKTTLLRVIAGLLAPSGGRGQVLGVSLRDPARRRLIGYAAERPAGMPGMTGGELVAYAGELVGLARRAAITRAHDVLAYVGLGEARHRPLTAYSTGMRQRLELACALAGDPPLLLLDEPTSGLDPEGRERMLALIAELAADHGKAIVLSTHLLPDAERICEHAIVLDRGRLVCCAPLRELLADDAPRWRLRCREDTARLAADLAASGHPVEEMADGCVLVPGELEPAALFGRAAALGLQLRELTRHRPSLEDALLQQVAATP